jgi:hypothetical protein
MGTLGTDTSKAGDEFAAAVVEDLVVEGHVVLREGSEVRGRVVDLQDGSDKRVPAMMLSIESVRHRSLDLPCEPILIQGKRQSKLKRILKGAGAAVVGAIVGKRAAGARGAIAGAGVGVASVLMTGDQVVLPEGTIIQFQLIRSVEVTASR